VATLSVRSLPYADPSQGFRVCYGQSAAFADRADGGSALLTEPTELWPNRACLRGSGRNRGEAAYGDGSY